MSTRNEKPEVRVTATVPEDSRQPIIIQHRPVALAFGVVERDTVASFSSDWDCPGVYVLFGDGSELPAYTVYVGMAKSLTTRLKQHASNDLKPWRRGLAIRRDAQDNFNTSEIAWLESHIWHLFQNAASVEVLNKQEPRDNTLDAGAQADLKIYLEPIRHVVRLLGYSVDPTIEDPTPDPASNNAQTLAYNSATHAYGLPEAQIATTDMHQIVFAKYASKSSIANSPQSIEHGVWGSPSPGRDIQKITAGDLIAMGYGFGGGSPRVNTDLWRKGSLAGLLICKVSRPYFVSRSAVWPDQADCNNHYEHRIGIEYLGHIPSVSIADLPLRLAEALRMSAVVSGRIYAVSDSDE